MRNTDVTIHISSDQRSRGSPRGAGVRGAVRPHLHGGAQLSRQLQQELHLAGRYCKLPVILLGYWSSGHRRYMQVIPRERHNNITIGFGTTLHLSENA